MADEFDIHPVVLATDTADMQAGTMERIYNSVTKGSQAAAISGALSIYNSFLFKENEKDIEQEIRKYDNSIGDYYAENKEVIDIVGFVGASFVPGGLGIKALNLARSGTALGTFGRALNLTASKKNYYLEKAIQEVAENGGTVQSILSKTRRTQLSWEVADQALMATAAELAIAATMHDSPVFQGDSLKDFGWNIALGTVLGGGIGGALAGFASKGVLKSAQSVIEGEKRLADTVFDPQKLGLLKGTEIITFAEQIAKLPDDFLNTRFQYKYDGRVNEVMLETSGVVRSAKERAEQLANSKLALKFHELAEGNVNAGNAYFAFIQEGMAAARAAGKSPDEIVGLITGYLANVDKIGAIDLERMALDKRRFYITRKPEGETALEKARNLFSLKRTENTSKVAYRLADGVEASDLQIARLDDLAEESAAKAFKANPELDAIQGADGRLIINQRSSRIVRAPEKAYTVRRFVDLRTGTMADDTVPVFGDTVTAGGVRFTNQSISNGKQSFMQTAMRAFDELADPIAASARFAWASKLDAAAFNRIAKGGVLSTDLPMLQRMAELEAAGQIDVTKIRVIHNGQDLDQFTQVTSMTSFVEAQKLDILRDFLQNWKQADGSPPDMRVLAARLNVNEDWIEEVIDRGFSLPRASAGSFGKNLPTSQALLPKNLEVEWNFGAAKEMLPEAAYEMNMGPSHLVTQKLTKEYQLAIRSNIGENAANAVLGEDAQLFWKAPSELSLGTSQDGAGATTFGASNAGYAEKAKLWVQDTGKNVALVAQKRRDATIGALTPHVNALRMNPAAASELGILTTALRKSEFRYAVNPEDGKSLVSTEALKLAAKEGVSIEEAVESLLGHSLQEGRRASQHILPIANQEVMDFLQAHAKINYERQGKFTALLNATGLYRKIPEYQTIYVPPINTVKYPYHAFVRTKDKIGVTSDVSMITAKSEQQLRELAARVNPDEYDVFYKADTANYFKVKGEYDYDMAINESRVNNDLARKGILADLMPETRIENVMTDWLEWHAKQEEKLVRNAVEVRNRQFFSEMRFLSENYRKESESVFRGIGSKFKSKVQDPFGDYVKTALNISKQQEFPLLDALNDFVDKVGVAAGDALARAQRDANNGSISWAEANKVAEKFGLGMPYRDVDAYLAANERFPKNLIRVGFQKANMWLANATLRLDFANSLINIISTPIMLGTELSSIKQLIGNDPALAGKLGELMSVAVPGRQGARVPSTTKLIGGAINNFFGEGKQDLLKRYRDIGAIKEVSQLYHEVLDDLAWNPAVPANKWVAKAEAAVEKGARITGNTFSEDLTRFVSADVMRQLSDPLVTAGKLTIQEQNAFISTFVNRVQGNYVTSQRPVVFQGTTGAAVSLFQTYAFNVLQQLHRHMVAGDKKTLLTFAGLQSTVFGFNGLPFFDAVNTRLIGGSTGPLGIQNNPDHHDAYSVISGFQKDLGDWMLYGTASAFPLASGSMPALYTRGDINPRHLTILPTNPMDVPAVQAGIKLFDTITGFGENVLGGSSIDSALLQAMEHQGWNRPLAGLAQVLAGRATTSQGSLISAANELQTTSMLANMEERMVNFGGASRIFGARPMDEAVALNQMYRMKSYQAMDQARIERLGSVVKSKLHNGELPTDEEFEDFMLRYTRSGGRIENFSHSLQRWMRDANVSIVNQMAQKNGTSYAQKLQMIMGGEMLPDYVNQDIAPTP